MIPTAPFALEEAITSGSMKLNDGSTVKVSKDDASRMTAFLKTLNGANKKQFMTKLHDNKKSFDDILSFTKEV